MTIHDNPYLSAPCLLCASRDYVWGHASTDDAVNLYGLSAQKPLTVRYRPPDEGAPPRQGLWGWLGTLKARYAQAPLLARTRRQCGNVQLFAGLGVPGKPKRG